MLTQMHYKWKNADPAFQYFLLGILFLGINVGILSSTFNNYVHDIFAPTADMRGFLEFPRELPGFLLIFLTAFLSFLPITYWAGIVGLLSFLGVLGMAHFSPTFNVMILWMFLSSLGDHLFMPVESGVGLALSKSKKEGRRLGQISGARNLAAISGSVMVFILFSFRPTAYAEIFTIAAVSALLSSYFFFKMKLPDNEYSNSKKFVFKSKYIYFYILNVLFGARKQIFLTFAPWVLISMFHTEAQTLAVLMTITSILGFFFRQVFGELTDRFGEKIVLSADAIILLIICIGFAFIQNIYVLYAFFIVDALMFATRIARTTYLNKIIDSKDEVAPTISLGISIDHIISMTVPMLGGLLWTKYGYQSVFYVAALIAFFNFIIASKLTGANKN